jgi:LPXTG-site transpeptidase (sortase) family protein
MLVNGIQVASRVDEVLAAGGVGVFVGGDGNEVALHRFTVRTSPDEQEPSDLNSAAPSPTLATATATVPAVLPITRVVIPSISLSSDARPAQLIHKDDGLTWDVPAFTIGHAEGTAGAGGPGNGVLIGHVTSRSMGNVFENLHRVQVGDGVQVFSSEREFNYRVVDKRTVGRTDVSIVDPTTTPSLTLITCTGVWLPLVSDYAERLVLRAELAEAGL